MLKSISLKNFQAHKDTEIEFTPGVNVIVGPSDRGKSAVIRALQLIFFNRPGGKAYIRHGAKECRVEVETASGDTLARVRTKSKNYYQVNGEDPLKAPGRDVPREITDVCNMQEINFQGQHDIPFMLAETAGECGRMLNRCVDLTVIDKTLNSLNTKKRNATSELEFVSSDITAKQGALGKYAKVDRMRAQVDDLQARAEKLDAQKESIDAISALIDSCSAISAQLASSADLEEATKAVTAFTADTSRVDAKYRQYQELNKALRDAERAQGSLVPTEGIEGALSEAQALKTRAEALSPMEKAPAELKTAIRKTKEASEESKTLAKEKKEYQAEYDELMGDACPLCGRGAEA